MCYVRAREAAVNVPVFEKHIALPGHGRVLVLDAPGVLRWIGEVRRALSSTSAVKEAHTPAFTILWDMLKHHDRGVCPAAFQYDPYVQSAIHVASLLESGYPLAEMPADFVDLVQIAASTMADYSIRKMDDAKKRADAHNRTKGVGHGR